MKRFLLLFALGSVVYGIYSCNPSGSARSKRTAKGSRVYGGTLHLNEITPVINLYPYYIYDNVSYTIACQLYDGLVKVNPKDLTVMPDIAKSWEVSDSGTLYTFHLRKDVTFQDDPCFPNSKGRKVTATDFKYSMEKLCTSNPNNVVFSITFKGIVEGADKYYNETKSSGKPSSGISGIKVVNDSTLQIRLLKRTPVFLNMLAGPG